MLKTMLSSLLGGPKKRATTFVHIFANYSPIFKILSLAHSADNLR